MVRPCFLVIDREFPGSISTRKLVIETAKFNVLTAYSATEALETLKLFPHLSGIVLDADVRDIPCSLLITGLREIQPKLPIIVIAGPSEKVCECADEYLDSFDPKRLLGILQTLEPEKAAEIEKQNEKLSRSIG